MGYSRSARLRYSSGIITEVRERCKRGVEVLTPENAAHFELVKSTICGTKEEGNLKKRKSRCTHGGS